MGLILSEPIKKVVEILKILTKMSVEDAKIHPKRPYSWGNREPGRVSTLFGFSSYPKYKNAAEKVLVTALCSIY